MSRRMLFAFLLCMLLLPAMTMAQAAGGAGGAGGAAGGRGGRRGGGAGGGRGNFDPAAFRQQQLDNIKVLLEATDDEWKVLSPKVEKLLTAQAANPRGGRGGGAGGRGGGRRGGGAGGAAPAPVAADPNNPVAVALQDLRTALDSKDTPAPTLAAKLKALRDARAKAATDLASSQKDLKEVLTQRQEAIMVSNGYLE